MKAEVTSSVVFCLSKRKDVEKVSPQVCLGQLSREKPAKNPQPKDLKEILETPEKVVQDVQEGFLLWKSD